MMKNNYYYSAIHKLILSHVVFSVNTFMRQHRSKSLRIFCIMNIFVIQKNCTSYLRKEKKNVVTKNKVKIKCKPPIV